MLIYIIYHTDGVMVNVYPNDFLLGINELIVGQQ